MTQTTSATKFRPLLHQAGFSSCRNMSNRSSNAGHKLIPTKRMSVSYMVLIHSSKHRIPHTQNYTMCTDISGYESILIIPQSVSQNSSTIGNRTLYRTKIQHLPSSPTVTSSSKAYHWCCHPTGGENFLARVRAQSYE